MRTPRVTAVQIVRVSRWKGGEGEAEAAKKRCRKLPFPRGDVMQKFDRRRELASLYVPTIPLIRLIRGETEKRASRYTVCIRLHPVCIMQERKKEASIHRRATESDFIPAYYFLYSMRIHRVSFLCYQSHLFSLHDVLLVINFFFSPFQFRQDVRVYIFIFISNV